MASDGSEMPSSPAEDQKHGGEDTEAGVPPDSQGGKEIPNSTTESTGQEQNGVCQFFLKGKCRFGQRCRLTHSDPSVDDSGAASPDQDDKPDQEKAEKLHKKVNKPKKPKYEVKEVNKKPRMRTADDVISRILWDPSVDSSEFIVGYVDRFLGVLERPFVDFNWDTNPCDCDYTTELALPRHRIQYFTYRGHRVWDRHSRTDRVFGSTGQSLAPPFGGEEEVKEEINSEDQGELHKITGNQPPVGCGQDESGTDDCVHWKDTHLDETKQREMNIHTPDSSAATLQCGRDTSQEQKTQACVMEEYHNSLKYTAVQMCSSQGGGGGGSVNVEAGEDFSAEWQWGLEGTDDDCLGNLGALNISQNPSAPLEQREEKRAGRPPKKRPTHFITFRANTPAVLSCFQQLQEEITSLLPSSAPHWQTVSSLHVTLCLLVLPGPTEVAAAMEILRQFAHLDRNPPVAVTFPVKLKHFNGKVLYLSPQPQLHLQQLNSGLQEAYRKEGLLHRDSYNPRYHLTLAKVEDKEGERIFEGVGDLKVGKGLNFGRLPVNTLHLCSMGMSKVDGFFDTVGTVTLR
ncbi:leukocyte receptor cluster member 9 isoform X2 [Cheilinus undulatus]|nr:leukocyte receptor cluster member 9 isoform X2 [Cheilinus undulatus]